MILTGVVSPDAVSEQIDEIDLVGELRLRLKLSFQIDERLRQVERWSDRLTA